MKNIKILIAEDNLDVREFMSERLKEYIEKKFSNQKLEIIECESYEKASQKISESQTKEKFFDIFFVDIDFTEDNKGGQRDSGYKLIEKAFGISPLTKIVVYSAQFQSVDLWSRYEELKNRGLVFHSMHKSHSEGGEQKWFAENFEKIFETLIENIYLSDIFINHSRIIEKLKRIKFDNDAIEDLQKKNYIISNLETILILFRSLKDFDAKTVIYRLIISLYHQSLEIFCKRFRTDNKIVKEFSERRDEIKDLLSIKLDKKEKGVTALKTILTYQINDKTIYGYKLNFIRNKSTHQDEKFNVDLSNALFASLAFSIYVLENPEIHHEEIGRLMLKSEKGKGYNDLKKIIEFIEPKSI